MDYTTANTSPSKSKSTAAPVAAAKFTTATTKPVAVAATTTKTTTASSSSTMQQPPDWSKGRLRKTRSEDGTFIRPLQNTTFPPPRTLSEDGGINKGSFPSSMNNSTSKNQDDADNKNDERPEWLKKHNRSMRKFQQQQIPAKDYSEQTTTRQAEKDGFLQTKDASSSASIICGDKRPEWLKKRKSMIKQNDSNQQSQQQQPSQTQEERTTLGLSPNSNNDDNVNGDSNIEDTQLNPNNDKINSNIDVVADHHAASSSSIIKHNVLDKRPEWLKKRDRLISKPTNNSIERYQKPASSSLPSAVDSEPLELHTKERGVVGVEANVKGQESDATNIPNDKDDKRPEWLKKRESMRKTCNSIQSFSKKNLEDGGVVVAEHRPPVNRYEKSNESVDAAHDKLCDDLAIKESFDGATGQSSKQEEESSTVYTEKKEQPKHAHGLRLNQNLSCNNLATKKSFDGATGQSSEQEEESSTVYIEKNEQPKHVHDLRLNQNTTASSESKNMEEGAEDTRPEWLKQRERMRKTNLEDMDDSAKKDAAAAGRPEPTSRCRPGSVIERTNSNISRSSGDARSTRPTTATKPEWMNKWKQMSFKKSEATGGQNGCWGGVNKEGEAAAGASGEGFGGDIKPQAVPKDSKDPKIPEWMQKRNGMLRKKPTVDSCNSRNGSINESQTSANAQVVAVRNENDTTAKEKDEEKDVGQKRCTSSSAQENNNQSETTTRNDENHVTDSHRSSRVAVNSLPACQQPDTTVPIDEEKRQFEDANNVQPTANNRPASPSREESLSGIAATQKTTLSTNRDNNDPTVIDKKVDNGHKGVVLEASKLVVQLQQETTDNAPPCSTPNTKMSQKEESNNPVVMDKVDDRKPVVDEETEAVNVREISKSRESVQLQEMDAPYSLESDPVVISKIDRRPVDEESESGPKPGPEPEQEGQVQVQVQGGSSTDNDTPKSLDNTTSLRNNNNDSIVMDDKTVVGTCDDEGSQPTTHRSEAVINENKDDRHEVGISYLAHSVDDTEKKTSDVGVNDINRAFVEGDEQGSAVNQKRKDQQVKEPEHEAFALIAKHVASVPETEVDIDHQQEEKEQRQESLALLTDHDTALFGGTALETEHEVKEKQQEPLALPRNNDAKGVEESGQVVEEQEQETLALPKNHASLEETTAVGAEESEQIVEEQKQETSALPTHQDASLVEETTAVGVEESEQRVEDKEQETLALPSHEDASLVEAETTAIGVEESEQKVKEQEQETLALPTQEDASLVEETTAKGAEESEQIVEEQEQETLAHPTLRQDYASLVGETTTKGIEGPKQDVGDPSGQDILPLAAQYPAGEPLISSQPFPFKGGDDGDDEDHDNDGATCNDHVVGTEHRSTTISASVPCEEEEDELPHKEDVANALDSSSVLSPVVQSSDNDNPEHDGLHPDRNEDDFHTDRNEDYGGDDEQSWLSRQIASSGQTNGFGPPHMNAMQSTDDDDDGSLTEFGDLEVVDSSGSINITTDKMETVVLHFDGDQDDETDVGDQAFEESNNNSHNSSTSSFFPNNSTGSIFPEMNSYLSSFREGMTVAEPKDFDDFSVDDFSASTDDGDTINMAQRYQQEKMQRMALMTNRPKTRLEARQQRRQHNQDQQHQHNQHQQEQENVQHEHQQQEDLVPEATASCESIATTVTNSTSDSIQPETVRWDGGNSKKSRSKSKNNRGSSSKKDGKDADEKRNKKKKKKKDEGLNEKCCTDGSGGNREKEKAKKKKKKEKAGKEEDNNGDKREKPGVERSRRRSRTTLVDV